MRRDKLKIPLNFTERTRRANIFQSIHTVALFDLMCRSVEVYVLLWQFREHVSRRYLWIHAIFLWGDISFGLTYELKQKMLSYLKYMVAMMIFGCVQTNERYWFQNDSPIYFSFIFPLHMIEVVLISVWIHFTHQQRRTESFLFAKYPVEISIVDIFALNCCTMIYEI